VLPAISEVVNSKISAGSREMMSSICQAWTRVSGGVAAWTAAKEVAMVVTKAADRRNFENRFIGHSLAALTAPVVREYECKSHKRCRV
jgi:hypothetical protein